MDIQQVLMKLNIYIYIYIYIYIFIKKGKDYQNLLTIKHI